MATVNGVALGPDSPLRSTSKKLRLGFTESQMQQAAVKLLVGDRGRTSWGMAETRPELRLLYAIPNQRRGKAEGGRMRGEGQLKGMCDLCLPLPRMAWIATYGALYLEAKLPGENPRKDQAEVIAALRDASNAVVICRSVEAIVEAATIWARGDAGEIELMLQRYHD